METGSVTVPRRLGKIIWSADDDVRAAIFGYHLALATQDSIEELEFDLIGTRESDNEKAVCLISLEGSDEHDPHCHFKIGLCLEGQFRTR